MKDDLVHLNGRLVRRGQATVSAFDRGFLYGDGFFETTRIAAGRAVFMSRHLARLAASCDYAGFAWDPLAAGLASSVAEVIGANRVAEGYLRITLSRGLHRGTLTDLAAPAPTVLVEARPMDLPPLDAVPPIALARSPYVREAGGAVVAHKSTSYQAGLLGLAEGRGRGADEVYFLNAAGHVTEGALSNVFFVHGGVVRTASTDCGLLPGVARAVVLEACACLGIAAEEGAWPEGALLGADEAFCTNSLRGLMPVARVVDAQTAFTAPGDATRRLQAAFAGAVQSDLGL